MAKLSPWCKRAKHAMIDNDVKIAQIADATGYTRQYVSSVLNGRTITDGAIKKISAYLDISDADEDPIC